MELTFFKLELFQVLQIMIFNAIYINGIVAATNRGFFLYPIKNFITDKFVLIPFIGKLISDALIGCIKCMSSVHGFYFFFGILWMNGINVMEIIQSVEVVFYIFYWFSLSVVNIWVQYINSILLRIISAPVTFK